MRRRPASVPTGCRKPLISSEAEAPPAAHPLCPVSLTEACGPDQGSRPRAPGRLPSSATTGYGFSPSVQTLERFRHLRTPNQLLYPSQLPLCQSLGPSLTDGLAPLSSRLLGLKGSAQHLARRVALVSGNAQHCLQEGSGTKLSWGGGGRLCMSHGLSGADADWKGCPSQPQLPMLPASPLRWQDHIHVPTSAPTHIQATHPCTQPHTCPYQHILIHKASLIAQEF